MAQATATQELATIVIVWVVLRRIVVGTLPIWQLSTYLNTVKAALAAVWVEDWEAVLEAVLEEVWVEELEVGQASARTARWEVVAHSALDKVNII